MSHSKFFALVFLLILVTLFDHKIQVSKTREMDVFNELLSTQNENVARFARVDECDYFSDFQTPWPRFFTS